MAIPEADLETLITNMGLNPKQAKKMREANAKQAAKEHEASTKPAEATTKSRGYGSPTPVPVSFGDF